jgi:endoglucanase
MVISLIVALVGSSGCGPTLAPIAFESLSLAEINLSPRFWYGTETDPTTLSRDDLLAESWQAYRQRFIQSDGRVIDWEDGGRTVSEGQAYAMLRAVLADDPDTFDLTLRWAEDNLRRPSQANDADGVDQLWAWKWGRAADGSWQILDENFASDADIDAITALIWAARRWQRPDYLDLARLKLADLWDQSTLALDTENRPRYLLPGPITAFQPDSNTIYLNPSYLAPYAFRLFAQVDPDRNWISLVDSSYAVLDQVSVLSARGLPGDWVRLDLTTQALAGVTAGSTLSSQYGFDAHRVWWRIAWDAAWFDEPRATAFLTENLSFLAQLWQQDQRIPAILSLAGDPLVDYDATGQYAMLHIAFNQTRPAIATEMYQQKLIPAYRHGIWDNANAYYVQNLAWLGLFPPEDLPPALLQESE